MAQTSSGHPRRAETNHQEAALHRPLQGRVLHLGGGWLGRGGSFGGRAGPQPAEGCLNLRQDLRRLYCPHNDQRHVVGGVVLLVELGHHRARDAPHRLGRAGGWQAVRVLLEGEAPQPIGQHLLRVLGGARQLCQDDPLFLAHGRLREGGVAQDIAERCQRLLGVLLGHHHQILGGVFHRHCLMHAAQALNLAVKLAGAARFAPLEHQVLKEVRDAVVRLGFVGRPGAHPHIQGHQVDGGRFLDNDPQAVWEGVDTHRRRVKHGGAGGGSGGRQPQQGDKRNAAETMNA
jgi:hypothetical protein